ncbi:MAG TPA: VTC domain-containing protein [Planctomycetes bacterium]|nr:VTC domain-containing protein [Planctomycetota bacterium]
MTLAEAVRRDPVRHELKLCCSASSLPRIRMALSLHPLAPRRLFPPRRVQSVYLDTLAGRAVEENLAGVSHREKVRLRWYGHETRGVRATLERKVRENTLGWKELAPLGTPIDVGGVSRRAFLRKLRAALPDAVRIGLEPDLEPVQWIRYEREYLATAGRRVRITLDRDLEAFDQRGRARLIDRAPTVIPRILVVELKCAPEDLDEARAIANALPVPVDRSSKFVLASRPWLGAGASLVED